MHEELANEDIIKAMKRTKKRTGELNMIKRAVKQ